MLAFGSGGPSTTPPGSLFARGAPTPSCGPSDLGGRPPAAPQVVDILHLDAHLFDAPG
jgi:hypothetical protein